MNNMKKGFILSGAAMLLVLGAAGCAGRKPDAAGKVTVALYDIKLLGEYTDYVEAQLPDVDFEWSVGKNSVDFFIYLQENNDLPDILTSRRFSLLDANVLAESLMNLDETELASSYHSIYLDKYRNEDNSVNWLPAPGIFDNLIANKALFEEYDIPLPVDFDSFTAACAAFEEKGIRGFISDYGYDYTCMELLQGVGIEGLSSLEGKTWRHDYENKIIKGLDDVVWPGAFERVEKLVDKGIFQAQDVGLDYYKVIEAFENGNAAMIRGTGAIAAECIKRSGMDVLALPYLGSTPEENWALTYPVFQTAVKKEGNEEDARRDLLVKVLEAMYSEDAQLILNRTIGAQISYNKDISLPLPEEMSLMEPLAKQNHIYIRIASNEFFKTSLDVFPKMMTGEYDAAQAYQAFNEGLERTASPEGETAAKLDKSYSSSWDDEKGNEAASSVANTVCRALGADVLVMPFYSVNCGIYAGEQTLAELGYPVQNQSMMEKVVTGAELKEFLGNIVSGTASANQLPILSGAAMEVKRTDKGFELETLTIQGKEASQEDEYRLIYSNKAGETEAHLKYLGGTDTFTVLKDKTLQGVWTEYLLEGNAPEESEDYVSVKQ